MKIRISIVKLSLAVALAFIVAAAPPPAAAENPLQAVKSGTDQVIRLLGQGGAANEVQRARIRTIVNQYFDFSQMAMRALGHHWKQQPPEKQQEFAGLFSDFIFDQYFTRTENATVEKATYGTQQIRGDYATVNAIITGSRGEDIPLVYHLINRDGNWKAYDIEIAGVSLLSNYRSQFNSILARESFDQLLNRLRQKITGRGAPIS